MTLHVSRAAQLRFTDVSFDRPDRRILDGVTFTVAPGDRIGLTGPNGAGKSTLLALATGEIRPDAGSVHVVPADATVGLFHQELRARPEESARAFVERAVGITGAGGVLAQATEDLASGRPGAADRYDRALQRWLALGGATVHERFEVGFERVGLRKGSIDQRVATMSGGERSRVGLAAIVLSEFDVLLLDEPTNDLDQAGLEILEQVLTEHPASFVVVSHDRRFLERTVNGVIEIDPHSATVTRFDGGWQSFIEEREVARAHAQRRYDDYAQKRSQLLDRARTERGWAQKGARRAVRSPSDNDKIIRSRAIETSENLAARARRTERAIERLEEVDKPWVRWELRFRFGAAARSGDVVFEMTDAVAEPDPTFRLGPISLRIDAGERVRIAGPNGAGKTTLVGVLLGDVPLTSGTRRTGSSVTVGRLDQERSLLESGPNLLLGVEALTGVNPEECRSMLAKFGLDAGAVERPSATVSPGERTRALLATFQLRGVNTVILDEPTNHLDMEAIEQLETALADFDGTLVVVSHDRAFLDALDLTRTITLP